MRIDLSNITWNDNLAKFNIIALIAHIKRITFEVTIANVAIFSEGARNIV